MAMTKPALHKKLNLLYDIIGLLKRHESYFTKDNGGKIAAEVEIQDLHTHPHLPLGHELAHIFSDDQHALKHTMLSILSP